MSRRTVHFALACLLLLPGLRADTLDEVLNRLDANAKMFKSFAAGYTLTDYTKVVDDRDVSNGTINVQRVKDSLEGKLVFEDGHVAYFDGKSFNIFYPKAKSVQIYALDKDTSQFVKLFLLGFGATRADLVKDFEPSLGGPDTVNGTPTTRIALKPRTDAQKQYMSQIELWIPAGKGYPVQEKITEPSGNSKMFTYSAMQMPAPPGTVFEFNLPPGTKKQNMK
jgi:outer membrane lipoprotein-sorting protein